MNGLISFLTAYATDAAAEPQKQGFNWYSIVMLVALGLIFYFLILRPQKKRDKESKQMRESLSVGDEVVTIGGMCGRISKIKDETVTIMSGDSKMTFLKSSIASITRSVAGDDEGPKAKELKGSSDKDSE